MLSIENGSPKILIVDDAPENIITLEHILEDLNYQIYTANNGDEALKQIEKVDPDLVLLDVIMPGKNGYEVARIVKYKPLLDEAIELVKV